MTEPIRPISMKEEQVRSLQGLERYIQQRAARMKRLPGPDGPDDSGKPEPVQSATEENSEKQEDAQAGGMKRRENSKQFDQFQECQTCKRRKYQDGSDDPGVSFKIPTRIMPRAAAAAVRGHEMEHVYREQAKADREGREVVSQSVVLHTGICPECGGIYISGGTTRTVTRNASELSEILQQEQRRAEL